MNETLRATRTVVAMSGGVDSSVAAALLVQWGHDVIGISLRLAPEGAGGSRGCCSLEDFQDAERVASRLGIPYYVFDMREAFHRSVVTPFIEEYLDGRTPSPCILCNREIKFGLLARKAEQLGATLLATGHYARCDHEDGRYRLLRGRDAGKDQSYFLFELGQRELAATTFPVGSLTKEEVRRLAAKLELPVANKRESQEICFVPDGNYSGLVEGAVPDRIRDGEIRDEAGTLVGRHQGVHRYTIGQRRGLGVASEQPWYVSALDADQSLVTVTRRSGLRRAGLLAEHTVWVSGHPEPEGSSVTIKVRYRQPAVPARLAKVTNGNVTVLFDEAQEAISPGQAVVFYRGEEVLGGGWIRSSIPVSGKGAVRE